MLCRDSYVHFTETRRMPEHVRCLYFVRIIAWVWGLTRPYRVSRTKGTHTKWCGGYRDKSSLNFRMLVYTCTTQATFKLRADDC